MCCHVPDKYGACCSMFVSHFEVVPKLLSLRNSCLPTEVTYVLKVIKLNSENVRRKSSLIFYLGP